MLECEQEIAWRLRLQRSFARSAQLYEAAIHTELTSTGGRTARAECALHDGATQHPAGPAATHCGAAGWLAAARLLGLSAFLLDG
jgi:hypothetical protein